MLSFFRCNDSSRLNFYFLSCINRDSPRVSFGKTKTRFENRFGYLFPQRGRAYESYTRETILFSRLCEPAWFLAGRPPHLVTVPFSRFWNKKLASRRRYNARRPLFLAAALTLHDPFGRGPCVQQIKLSWKQTGTRWPRSNKLTPSRGARSARGPRCPVSQLEGVDPL